MSRNASGPCAAQAPVGEVDYRRVTSLPPSQTAVNRYRRSGIRTYTSRPVQPSATGFDVLFAVLFPYDARGDRHRRVERALGIFAPVELRIA